MKPLFKIHPDKESDTLWIVFKKGPIEYYEELVPGVNIEFDEKDRILGIEILHYSRLLTERQYQVKNSKVYSETEDDILNIYLTKGKLDDSDHIDRIIIAFDENSQPLDIEILEASKMLKDSKLKTRRRDIKTSGEVQISIPHRIK